MSTPRYATVVVSQVERLDEHREAWWRLHAVRLEDNAFASPAVVPLFFRSEAADRHRLLTFVYRTSTAGRELVAVAPFEVSRRGGSCFLGESDSPFLASPAPLLHREFAAPAAAALWRWADHPDRPWSTVRFAKIGLQTRGWKELAKAIDDRARRWWVSSSFERPVVDCRHDFDDWLERLPAEARSEYRVGLRRLGSRGDLRVRVHRNLADYDLVQRFLQLERGGQRTAQGSALAADPENVRLFDRICRRLGDRNELMFVELELDGRPVAISANLIDGRSVFGLRVAGDPAHADCSPSVLSLIELSRLVHQDPVLGRIDSSAGPDSFLMPYWPDRTPVGSVIAAAAGFSGDLLVRMLPFAHQTRLRARAMVQRLRPKVVPATA